MQIGNDIVPPIDLAAVFTLLFVTLGPIKLLAPFSQATREVDETMLSRLALWTFVVGTIAALAGGFIGKILVGSWQISLSAITLAGALIFLLIGLRLVLEPYTATHVSPPPVSPKTTTAVFQLAFPAVVTPYGLVAVVVLLASSASTERTVEVVVVLVAVMVLNLLAMRYIRHIMGPAAIAILQIVGAVLAVIQVALAVQFILRGLRLLGLL